MTTAAPRDDSCESIDSDTSSKAPSASFTVTFRRFLDLIRFAVIELQLHENADVTGEDTFSLTAHLTAVRLTRTWLSCLKCTVTASLITGTSAREGDKPARASLALYVAAAVVSNAYVADDVPERSTAKSSKRCIACECDTAALLCG